MIGKTLSLHRTAVLTATLLFLVSGIALAESENRDHPFYPVIEDAVAKSVMNDLLDVYIPDDPLDAIMCIENSQFAACIDPNTPYDRMIELLHTLPTASEFDDDRYWRADRWVNTAHGNAGGLGDPITLTYSFIPDGTTIYADGGAPSELYATLTAQFGDEETWKQIFADCFADWSSHIGITYYEVSDDGAAFPGSVGVIGSRGDLRIGGHHVDGSNGVLAYNYFPDVGDMVMDTDENWAQGNLRFIRNTVMHEHGHGQGLGHTTPENGTKLMEAYLNTNFLGPQEDDIRGGSRNYGDGFESDNDAATANQMGTWEGVRVTIDHNLDGLSDFDWFEFHTIATSEIDITFDPIGQHVQLGIQGGSAPQWYDTDMMMDLGFKLFDSDLNELVYVEDGDKGDNEMLVDYVVDPGTYFIQVLRQTGTTGVDVQRYNMLQWITITDPTDVDDAVVPATGLQASVYPNPFNPKTTLRFFAPQAGAAMVEIYDMGGHRVDRLAVVANEVGWVETEWDGKTSGGDSAASGIYFMKVRIGEQAQTVRAVLLK
jgi:hypothetical protein